VAKSAKGWSVPALLGGAGLMVGAFAPAVVVDYYGEISLREVAETQAVLVVLAGAAALAAALLSRPRWVLPAALVAWVGILLPLIQNWLAPEDDSFFGQIGDALTGAVSDSVGDSLGKAALDLTSVSWGVAPLLGGLLLVSYAAWRTLR